MTHSNQILHDDQDEWNISIGSTMPLALWPDFFMTRMWYTLTNTVVWRRWRRSFVLNAAATAAAAVMLNSSARLRPSDWAKWYVLVPCYADCEWLWCRQPANWAGCGIYRLRRGAVWALSAARFIGFRWNINTGRLSAAVLQRRRVDAICYTALWDSFPV